MPCLLERIKGKKNIKFSSVESLLKKCKSASHTKWPMVRRNSFQSIESTHIDP